MGIFRPDTEEEKLIKALRNDYYLGSDFINAAVEYIDKINKGERKNDFFESDFLVRVILEMAEVYKDSDDTISFEKQLEDLKNQASLIFPEGNKTENYEQLKERFISQYCGIDGYVNLGITRNKNLSSFYGLFPNEEEFFKVLRVITNKYKNSDKKSDIAYIIEYAIKCSPYCTSYDELKSEIISYMSAISDTIIDTTIEEYTDSRIKLIQEKCGIYSSVDEGTLALISSEVQKLEGYVIKLRNLERRIESYDKRIENITKSGIETIKTVTQSSKDELQSLPELAKKQLAEEVERLNKQLDDYLLELEGRLKTSSDEVFNQLLESASIKLRELKSTIQLITTTTDQDLARIRKQTQDSVDALVRMTESDEKLQIALDTVTKHESMQKGLEVLASMGGNIPSSPVSVVEVPTGNVVIPALEREVLPADPTIIIPSSPTGLIPAFDYKIPLKERKKKIIAEMKRREDMGELFHEKSEEIIDCMLEGDWPYLYGPSGCGKTYTVEQIASLLGTEVIENGRITDDYTVLGYYDPQGKFRATATYVALAYGKILFLDEMDTGVPETQTNFNPIYSKLISTIEHPGKPYYVKFASDRQTLVNPNFRIISAGNTKGGGENAQFNARLQIDESVQQRMTQIEFKYDNRVEKIIFRNYLEWYNFFCNFRKVCDEYAEKHGLAVAPGITTTRDAQAIVRYLEHDSKPIETILMQKFIQTKDDTYINFLRQRFAQIYNLEARSVYDTKKIQPSKADEKVLAKKFISCCSTVVDKQ